MFALLETLFQALKFDERISFSETKRLAVQRSAFESHKLADRGSLDIDIIQEPVGRGGTLVDSAPFIRRVAGTNLALVATYRPWPSLSLAVVCGASARNSDTVVLVVLKSEHL